MLKRTNTQFGEVSYQIAKESLERKMDVAQLREKLE